jgi:hypothetical protein
MSETAQPDGEAKGPEGPVPTAAPMQPVASEGEPAAQSSEIPSGPAGSGSNRPAAASGVQAKNSGGLGNDTGEQSSSNKSHRAITLIVFAWAIDWVGAGFGLINSTYTTFGNKLPANLWDYVLTLPWAVVALAELGRVPFASAIYSKKIQARIMAIIGMLALSGVAVENWMFGFERTVNFRAQTVNVARQKLMDDEATLAALQSERSRITTSTPTSATNCVAESNNVPPVSRL